MGGIFLAVTLTGCTAVDFAQISLGRPKGSTAQPCDRLLPHAGHGHPTIRARFPFTGSDQI
jgi:hypothetical protein